MTKKKKHKKQNGIRDIRYGSSIMNGLLTVFKETQVNTCTARTGPQCCVKEHTIFSEGVLAFRLQDKTELCSVPTMNLVGMVGSYSRDTPPCGRGSFFAFGHSRRDSVGSPSFRMSHHSTWPSVLVEKHSVPGNSRNL